MSEISGAFRLCRTLMFAILRLLRAMLRSSMSVVLVLENRLIDCGRPRRRALRREAVYRGERRQVRSFALSSRADRGLCCEGLAGFGEGKQEVCGFRGLAGGAEDCAAIFPK